MKAGAKHSEEAKKKISEALKGKNNPNYGKKHSNDIKKSISNNLKGRFKGKNSPRWNPNLTNEDRVDGRDYPEYNEWRKAVYEKDDYTCQVCGKKGGFNAHHLEGYNSNKELRTTLSNGVTLCKKCHDNFHHIYGKGNNTKEQFEEFRKRRV